MPGLHRLHGVGGAADRRLGNLAGMGVAGGFAGDRAEAETLARIEARRFEPAIVEDQPLRPRMLEIELAVVCALQGIGDKRGGLLTVEAGVVEDRVGGVGHGGDSDAGDGPHMWHPTGRAKPWARQRLSLSAADEP